MAAMVATDIKSMLTIHIKPRADGLSDQYNRIFMVKILLISSLVMSVSWFKDSINCIVPKSHGIDGGFVSATCWIQGVYVYKELQNKVDIVGYYGMPKNMDQDGMLKGTEDLCETNPKLDVQANPNCRAMTKTFFLQYQYMPFLIAAIAIMYYGPYIGYQSVNQDLMNLRKDIKNKGVTAEQIIKSYFNQAGNAPKTLTVRVLLNILIKVLYVAANLITLLGLNNLLNGDFIAYGTEWGRWASLENHLAYDYMGVRDFPKPGNHLLPPFGYCEMYESARDVKQTLANKHKFVCELSQNILYQYVLIVLWFCIIIGILVSTVGLVVLLMSYAIGMFGPRSHSESNKKIFKALSFREVEYLEYMNKKNVILYEEVLERVRENLLGPNAPSIQGGYPLLHSIPEERSLYPSIPQRELNG